MNPRIIGTVATILSAIATMPQVCKVYRERSANDISFLSYLTVMTASILWGIYGFLIKEWPIIACNVIIIPLAFMTLIAKWIFRGKTPPK
jgi:MtN3 and saliva related transmembrane protein